MVAKKKVRKKTTKKAVKKVSKKSKKKIVEKGFLELRKKKALANFIRSIVAFVIFLVLYFVTSNSLLEDLFGLGALVTGAIAVAFILIFVGVILYKAFHKRKR